MKDYGTEVRLLRATPNAEATIEWAGRLCYAVEGKTRPEWIQDRISDGHLSILEHASATIYTRASRVFTHEWVRHRIAAFSQRSQRYVKEDGERYITPPDLVGLPPHTSSMDYPAPEGTPWEDYVAGEELFVRIMNNCWRTYFSFLRRGVKPEIARYVLPNACETQIVTTMNFRELRHVIQLRTSPRALPEMREVARKVRDICVENWPRVFGDLGYIASREEAKNVE